MGGSGSGRKRRAPVARCPLHPGSTVIAKGFVSSEDRTRRRYRCDPLIGDRHTFTAVVAVGPHELARVASWSPPPPCPKHPGSKVVRNGTYGSHTPKPRQLYRCYPADGSKFHGFTPPLPRDHVHQGHEHCDECEELRGIHRGETAVARRHSWSTRIVVRGLEKLASGASYSDVGRWALRVTGTRRTKRPSDDDATTTTKAKPNTKTAKRKPAKGTATDTVVVADDAKKKSAGSVASRNAWHIAADWTEAFSPVIYEPVERRLRQRALAERVRLDERDAAGLPLERPQVLLIDDMPVYGRDLDGGKARRDAGFYVLAAAEVRWASTDPFSGPDVVTELRLLRSYAKSNTAAWRLMFDELGYRPDFVVADAGRGLNAAIDVHFDPAHTKLIPSLWHLAQKIETALAGSARAFTVTGAGKRLVDDLDNHLRKLSRTSGVLADVGTWATWWDELDDLLRTLHLPVEKVRARRRTYEPQMAKVLADINTNPDIPISTGGLETLLAKNVKPILAMRRTGFANLERTNMLLDLVIARHHGAFDNLNDIVQLIRADTTPHGGWTVPLRSISDPRPAGGTYSSLRDATLLSTIASQRGLT